MARPGTQARRRADGGVSPAGRSSPERPAPGRRALAGRLAGVLLALAILGGGAFLFLRTPGGQALATRAQHLGWSDARDAARQIDDGVRAGVVAFLASPTPLPTEPPAPSPTPRPTATPWPTAAPTDSPAPGATPDLTDQVVRDYLAALDRGDRVRALNDWADPQETTATALIDAALTRGERYRITNLASRPSPLDPGLRQVAVTATVTVGGATTPDVHLVYLLERFDGAWKITARIE